MVRNAKFRFSFSAFLAAKQRNFYREFEQIYYVCSEYPYLELTSY